MKVEVCNGKYTVVAGEMMEGFRALRYGQEWRDLCGDNLVYYLAVELQEERDKNKAAIAEGMRRAAEICHKQDLAIPESNSEYSWISRQQAQLDKQAILTAMNNLKKEGV